MFKEITKDNWLLFAQHHYDNPTLSKEQEFYDDLKRFMYIKRLFNRYSKSGEISERLIGHSHPMTGVPALDPAPNTVIFMTIEVVSY